jgi:hypothetical protein
LRLQHSQKQITVPPPQFGKLQCAQTGKKQHVAGGIVAKEYALATVEGKKMGVPTTQRSRLAITFSPCIRQIDGGGNPRS